MLLLGGRCIAPLQAQMRAQRLLPMAGSAPEDWPVHKCLPLPRDRHSMPLMSVQASSQASYHKMATVHQVVMKAAVASIGGNLCQPSEKYLLWHFIHGSSCHCQLPRGTGLRHQAKQPCFCSGYARPDSATLACS